MLVVYPFQSAVTESGYRIAFGLQGYVNDTNSCRNIGRSGNNWVRHGANISGVGSVITNSYGIFLGS